MIFTLLILLLIAIICIVANICTDIQDNTYNIKDSKEKARRDLIEREEQDINLDGEQ